MELGTNGFPWTVTTDPLPLVKKLLDAGADPNAAVNNTPRGRNRNASPRIVFASALHRAAFAGDLELSKLLLSYGANPHAVSSDRESMLEAAAGLALIPGYQVNHPKVGTFLPNNSVEYHAETSELMLRLMKEKGIKHTTSECTLRVVFDRQRRSQDCNARRDCEDAEAGNRKSADRHYGRPLGSRKRAGTETGTGKEEVRTIHFPQPESNIFIEVKLMRSASGPH